MSIELLIGLAVFSVVAAITPGPNNILLLTSGVNFGYRRTVPHLLGICIGFFLLLLSVGFGLGALLKLYPPLFGFLKIAALIYFIYLSWRIAMSRSLKSAEQGSGRPMNFLEAALFQWVNPKSWVMSLSAMTIYVHADKPILSIFIVAAVFSLLNFPSASCWAVFGVALRDFLSVPRRLRMFNITMAILLMASVVPIFLSESV